MSDSVLTIKKPRDLAVQDVKILDSAFRAKGRATLSDGQQEAEFRLEPGNYMLVGSNPNAVRRQKIVSLGANEERDITIEIPTPSPHEWLVPINDRGLMPKAGFPSTQHLPSLDLRDFFEARPGLLQLPLGDRFYEKLGEIRGPNAGVTAAFEIKSYVWSSQRGQFNRSPLLELVNGNHAEDFTLISFPPRNSLEPEARTHLHYLKISNGIGDELVIALPLFNEHLDLVLAMPKAAAAERGQMIDWRISQNNPMLDGLLQMMTSEPLGEADQMIESSVALARPDDHAEQALGAADPMLRDKLLDPYAAVVAALVMLKYRRLERRAKWVENLANWFPWLPDAQLLSAWSNLMFADGDLSLAAKRIAALHDAGPPVFTSARRLARDLAVLFLDAPSELDTEDRERIKRLSARLGKEMRFEIANSPIYAFKPASTLSSSHRPRREQHFS